MDEFCPLCRKMGQNKRITIYQVNFEEAVWLCEEPACPWPFGYEDFRFTPRRLDEMSTRPLTKAGRRSRRESAKSISPGLGIYTPPMTPSSDGSSKDSMKTDGKISPNFQLTTTPTAQSIKQEDSRFILDIPENQRVISIFDIDSTIPLAKIEILTDQITNSRTNNKPINAKSIEDKSKMKIRRKTGNNGPQIRSIEKLPSNLIKIETKEEMPMNQSGERLIAINPKIEIEKRPLEAQNQVDEIPKKKIRVSENEASVTHNLPATLQPENKEAIQGQLKGSQEIVDFENAVANQGQSEHLEFDGLFDDMLIEGCQNMTQDFDEDWLNSLLI